ncbi:rhodanese-like domain-containing protein [Actinosynnema sp. CS-041913]|uniref:rhodanese-like domain-containing protein n=1 Tax=Actinosynnema sp. CS-041913 TaxID=3239917 RepID=UPI003D8EE996
MSAESFLEEAREDLRRIAPEELAGLSDALVVDIRPHHNRLSEGEIPGSVAVERIVLEWRLDPRGEHRIPGFDVDTTVVVLCNEGYASSLAARDLRRVGLPNATDLVGGFRAYAAAGLPVRDGATPAVT